MEMIHLKKVSQNKVAIMETRGESGCVSHSTKLAEEEFLTADLHNGAGHSEDDKNEAIIISFILQ
jgi:hypothetical protein